MAKGVELELLAPELMHFDLEQLGAALLPERDLQFTYLGLQTLYDRYFIHSRDVRIELPQIFFMRVARITSYNVCYTKLLRLAIPLPGKFPPPALSRPARPVSYQSSRHPPDPPMPDSSLVP